MAEYLIQDTTLTGIADAVRAKTGKTGSILVSDMASEIANISTGVELNFEVVGGTIKPVSPTENMIWVNTDTEITSWAFSTYVPELLEEGMVWFNTSANSLSEFNALKENNIMVYPNGCSQYINGAWIEKDATTYINGSWVYLRLTLYNAGILNEITGGMVQKGVDLYDGIRNETTNHCAGSCNVTTGTSSMRIASVGATCAIAYFNNKVNLTPYKTLVFSGSISENNGHTQIGIWSEFNVAGANHNRVAVLEGPLSDGTYNIDISELSGEHYIGFLVSGFTDYNIITVKEVYLK